MASHKRQSDSWIVSVFAGLAFILWGLYANWQHGWTARIQVALTQGVISFISTYFSAELIVAWVKKFQGSACPVPLSALASYIVIYMLVLGGHFVAGTPEYWRTVIPGMITGFFFCFGYSLRVHKKLNST